MSKVSLRCRFFVFVMFNVYPCLKSKVGQTIALNGLITRITTPNEIAVKAARLAAEFGKHDTEYTKIKELEIEVFSPNLYTPQNVRKRAMQTQCEPTGYVYLDFDKLGTEREARAFRDHVVKHDFIAYCWLSLSKTGLGALALVDGNTEELHNLYWDQINAIFEGRLDKDARAYSKVCCIPFDETLFVNEQPSPFPLTKELIDSSTSIKRGGQQVAYFREKDNRELLNPHPLHLNTVLWKTQIPGEKFEDVNMPYVSLQGEDFLEIHFGELYTHKIKLGDRNRTLAALSMQFIYLNYGRAKKSQILNALLSINRHCTEEPLEEYEVRSIFEANYTRHEKQGLDVSKYFNREKKVFWHPDCKLSGNERRSIAQTLLLKARGKGKEYTEQLIYDTIEALQDGISPITKPAIMELTGLKQGRVKKYWKPFKPLVDAYNASLEKRQAK